MQAIGERLREARMRRKIDVAEVEAATKIRAKYLRALEHEDFDLLPGPTFVKTFLRTYADYLGLDAQLLIDEYRAQYEPREAEPQPLVPVSRRRDAGRRRPRAPSGPPGPGTAVVVAVVVVLLIFVILGVTGGTGGGGSQPGHTTPKVAGRAAPRPKPKPAAPTSVVLHVIPNGPTYVCVDHGAGTPAVIDTDISRPMTFRGRHVRINAGKPDVTLIANGRHVAIPPTPNPVAYDFKPSGTTPIPPGRGRPCLG